MPTQESPEIQAPPDAGVIESAGEMHEGDRVVYPNQGVCRVAGIQAKEIAGQRLEFVAMTREEDNATILVPVAKVPSIGLRKVADSNELGDVFDLLASSFDDPELDWKVRHRLHGDLLSAGGILGVAEVLKGLQALANLRPLPQKERERYDAARHLLVAEVAVALGVPHATSEDFIDLALIPPPGTQRPAAKPRRLATLPAKPLRPTAPRLRGKSPTEELSDLTELGLDEELGDELELEGTEEEAEAPEEGAEEGAEAEAEAEEEAEEKPKRKAPAKKKAAEGEEAKKPARKAAAKTTAAKSTKAAAAKKAPAEKKPAAEKKPRATKAAKAGAEGEAEAAPKKRATRKKTTEGEDA